MRLKVAVWDSPLFCFVVIVVVSLLDSRFFRSEVHRCVTNCSLRNSRKDCGSWWNILREFVHCTISFGKKRQKWRNHVGPNLAIFYYGKIVLNQILVFFHSITSLAVVKKHSWQWPNVHYFYKSYNGKKYTILNNFSIVSTVRVLLRRKTVARSYNNYINSICRAQ